jgi:hypothetical protein
MAVKKEWMPRKRLIACLTALPLLTFSLCVAIPAFAIRLSNQSHQHASRPRSGTLVIDTLDSLRLEKAFLESVNALSGDDSVNIVFNIPRQQLSLTIRGCAVRQCPVLAITTCPTLEALRREGALPGIIVYPFIKTHEIATIVKVPSKVKRAPKDSLAATAVADAPEPFEKVDVRCVMYFGNCAEVDITQAERNSIRYVTRRALFELRKAIQTLCEAAASYAHGSPPQPRLRLKVVLSRDDATALYRASAAHCKLSLRP